MFTFKQYDKYMQQLSSHGYYSNTISSITSQKATNNKLFLKHDVETDIKRALTVAKIEAKYGHRATYYIQGNLCKNSAALKLFTEISKLGHEVSLHYDVLDANEGNFEKAIQEFQDMCDVFASLGSKVKTVCPHGNPTKFRTGWKSNKDFFKSMKVRQLFPDVIDIVVDFDILLPDGEYYSDAGFRLRKIENISHNDITNSMAMNDGVESSVSEIKDRLRYTHGLVLSLHTHRFRRFLLTLKLKMLVFFAMKKTFLILKRLSLVNKLGNRLHFLVRYF